MLFRSLSKIIELGLANKSGNEADELFSVVNSNSVEEIKAITTDILSKSGLTETYNRLSVLQSKK